jgi:hypothetical protein
MLDIGPVTDPGCVGMLLLTALHLWMLDPHGPVAVTHTDGAPVKGVGKFTVTEGVLAPLAKVAPAGTVQLYPVAPVTAGMEKDTPVLPGHIFAGPVINAGVNGVLLMVMHLAGLVDDPPQDSAAVTHSWPVVNAAGKVTCTFWVPCPLVTGVCEPDKVQVYTVAPPDGPQL